MTTAAITSTGRHNVNFNGGATQAFKYTDTAGGNLASFGQFYNTSNYFGISTITAMEVSG